MNFVNLKIYGQNINLNTITETLCIAPTFSYNRGDECTYRGKTITYNETCWIASMEIENADETEKKTLAFINLFYEKRDYIKKLSNECSINLWITLYQEDNQYNLHFSNEVLLKISELGADVDITNMKLEEFYSM